MNFSEIIKTLNSASAFDLYRMRAAIDRVLDEPRWLQSVQVRLKVGQEVEYFDPQSNALKRGRVLEMRRKQAVVLDLDDPKRWLISYAAKSAQAPKSGHCVKFRKYGLPSMASATSHAKSVVSVSLAAYRVLPLPRAIPV